MTARELAARALARAANLADLDGWRTSLPGGVRGLVARRLAERSLMRAARVLDLGADWARAEPPRFPSTPSRTESTLHATLARDPDPVGAKVALLQAAYLLLVGRGDRLEASSRADLMTRFRAALDAYRPPASRAPLVAIGLALVVTLAVALWPPPAPPPPPPSHLAASFETPWVEAVTDWVVALDQRNRRRAAGALSGPMREAEDALAAHRVAALDPALGEAPRSALGAVLDAAESTSLGGEDWESHDEALAERVRDLNRVFAEAGLGYFVDVWSARTDDRTRAEVGLFVFRVVSRARFQSAEVDVDAVHLRRLDRLNLVQFLLGYTSKRMDVAVVLLDKLEAELVTRLGPALAAHAEMPLRISEVGTADEALLREVKARAGRHVREAAYAAIPSEQQALTDLGDLLGRRARLIATANEALSARNVKLREFEAFAVDKAQRDALAEFLPAETLATLDDLQRRLDAPEFQHLALRLLARHASTVEQHELQHRLDYADGDFAPPAILLAQLGLAPDSPLAKSPEIQRIAYELSAYLAELARDPAWAKVNLGLLAEHLYDGSGGAEGLSARLILEGLHTAIRPGAEAPDASTPARAAALHLALMDRPSEALATQAEALWTRWFGRDTRTLAPLVRLEAAGPDLR
jgi:hypothetical protein